MCLPNYHPLSRTQRKAGIAYIIAMSPRRVLGTFSPSPHPDLSLGTTKAEAGEDEHLVFAFAFGNSEGFRRSRRFSMRPHFFKQCSLGDQGLSPAVLSRFRVTQNPSGIHPHSYLPSRHTQAQGGRVLGGPV